METVGGMMGTIAWSAIFREVVGGKSWILKVPYGVNVGFIVCVLGCVVVLGRVGKRVIIARTEV